MQDDDEDLFARAMSKVRPISTPEKASIRKKPSRRRQAKRIVEHVAAITPAPDSGSAAPEIIPASPDEPWTLVANGISRERLKRLAAGQPAVDTIFDLHGITRAEALQQLDSGFQKALACGQRVICIIHGRGLHSDGRPVLKQAAYHWLREGPFAAHVLAVIPQPGSGGGACLVLLRKH
ncbi:MAG: Smr/MutS family protein [Mariprofundaceae bacterium]